MTDVLEQQQMGQAAAALRGPGGGGGDEPPEKDLTKPGRAHEEESMGGEHSEPGFNERQASEEETCTVCGRHKGPHLEIPRCKICGKKHAGECWHKREFRGSGHSMASHMARTKPRSKFGKLGIGREMADFMTRIKPRSKIGKSAIGREMADFFVRYAELTSEQRRGRSRGRRGRGGGGGRDDRDTDRGNAPNPKDRNGDPKMQEHLIMGQLGPDRLGQ